MGVRSSNLIERRAVAERSELGRQVFSALKGVSYLQYVCVGREQTDTSHLPSRYILENSMRFELGASAAVMFETYLHGRRT